MFELAIKTIEEKITSEKNSLEYYQKEIDKYTKYRDEKQKDIEYLEAELKALKAKLSK